MKTQVIWALVVLNVLLLMSFVSRFGRENSAHAQNVMRPGITSWCPAK